MAGARIRPLSEFVANQIAAGEVVERPASIVKELIENSLDARASSIDVAVEQAGVRRIKVLDDGLGIHPDDLPLAVSRHATSKINMASDLTGVDTLGFRGEALASAASVSRLTITSRHAEADSAWQLAVDAGATREHRPAAHPQGTTVDVEDLFHNTPARRKFLKTERTELLHVQDVVKRIALAKPEVAFALAAGSRSIDRLAPGPIVDRIGALLGESFVEASVHVDETGGAMRLWGWVGLPTHSDRRAVRQHFYVNGRAVRDRIAGHAVRQAYRDVLFHGRHPAFVLFLDLPPSAVDVNVHPTKDEVRFRASRDVHDFVFGKLARVLRTLLPGEREGAQQAEAGDDGAVSAPDAIGPHRQRPIHYPERRPTGPSFAQLFDAATRGESVQSEHASHALATAISGTASPEIADASDGEPTPGMPPLGFAIAQLHGIYVLAQNADGLVVVDMHAAHERIVYEKMKAELLGGALRRQRLLVPVAVDVTVTEADLIEARASDIEALGLVIERTGPASVAVRELPVLLGNANVLRLVRDLIADFVDFGSSDLVAEAQERLLASAACHSSIRANRELAVEEMNALLRTLETTPNGGQCNHGRPTFVVQPLKALDQLFLRGQ